MIFEVLQNKITQAALLIPGESLFQQFMPAEISIGAMMRIPLTGIAIDPHLPGFFMTEVQIITRHSKVIDGSRLANEIAKCITTETVERFVSTDYDAAIQLNLVYPKTLPISFPRLEGNGFEWSQHFKLVYSQVLPWN